MPFSNTTSLSPCDRTSYGRRDQKEMHTLGLQGGERGVEVLHKVRPQEILPNAAFSSYSSSYFGLLLTDSVSLGFQTFPRHTRVLRFRFIVHLIMFPRHQKIDCTITKPIGFTRTRTGLICTNTSILRVFEQLLFSSIAPQYPP